MIVTARDGGMHFHVTNMVIVLLSNESMAERAFSYNDPTLSVKVDDQFCELAITLGVVISNYCEI